MSELLQNKDKLSMDARVLSYQTDRNALLKPSYALRFMQEAAAEHTDKFGYGTRILYDDKKMFILISVSINFEKMPFLLLCIRLLFDFFETPVFHPHPSAYREGIFLAAGERTHPPAGKGALHADHHPPRQPQIKQVRALLSGSRARREAMSAGVAFSIMAGRVSISSALRMV